LLLRRVVWQNFTDVPEMLAASIIGTIAFYQTKRRNNAEDSHLHTHRGENLKFYLA
jgi:hypothetical protein